MARGAASSTPLPWWATRGGQTCSFCLQSYHYEVAVHCPDCDRPVCPSCVVRLSVEVLTVHCPECDGEGEGEEG